ncbi:hypothetical protein IQ250_29380, partial [Pseudanabaenaceae cyanobacterium LEGE 13415]|nr:hypothetical protein [Pseudanabaenaceae cyanobacterium LEGE 13415]
MEQQHNNYGRDQNIINHIYASETTDPSKENALRRIKFSEDFDLRGEVYELNQIKRRAIATIGYAALSFAVPLFCDLTGFFPLLGFQTSYIPVIFLTTSILAVIKNGRYISIFLNRKKLAQGDEYIGRSRFLRQISDSSYEIYGRSATCSYYECCGKVYLVPPPEVGEFPRKFVGECSIGGKEHTYR